MWLSHPLLNDLVRDQWMQMLGDITYKEDQLARVLKFINRLVFGNLFGNKKKLRARIAGVQKVLAHHRSNRLERIN